MDGEHIATLQAEICTLQAALLDLLMRVQRLEREQERRTFAEELRRGLETAA